MNIELLTTVLRIVISTALFFVWVVRYDNIIMEFRKDYNYPDWLRDLTGIAKLTCAVMLLSTNTELNELGLKGIITLMAFAILTHIKVKSQPRKAIPSVLLMSLCLALLYFSYSMTKTILPTTPRLAIRSIAPTQPDMGIVSDMKGVSLFPSRSSPIAFRF